MQSVYKQNNLKDVTLTTLYENGKHQVAQKVDKDGCQTAEDIYASYVYEYDITNQIMNSLLEDPNSETIKRINTFATDTFAEECYRRNLIEYVIDDAHLVRIMDVSKLYRNEPTSRFYVSVNCSKNLISLFINRKRKRVEPI
ncbi:unnamed protein product [Didymodactylos carnosus]|uniref:Uncharacterized protein n=1 Tax=Didymodactylos carnosus TaxID=1234261 RepID=A0A8S2HVA6_9BILA|nr:unnamed protein product [Didymodactylos carnosus]CAF3685205.1 unnamed protein product [Didymodactylos carnosus]